MSSAWISDPRRTFLFFMSITPTEISGNKYKKFVRKNGTFKRIKVWIYLMDL